MGARIWPLNEHKNLRLDNKQDIHMNSESIKG